MLIKKRLPLFIAIIFIVEILIYLWSAWTSTFAEGNFFGIQSPFIFDKCARLAGRISSGIILSTLLMVGYYGLRKIYSDDKKKDLFLILMTLFTINHLIHLLFVFLRFRSHLESITLAGPIDIGGTVHGIITFSFIVIIPIILWNYKHLNKILYTFIILHLLNISSFMIKTFFGSIKPPDHPAYHNQFGVLALTVACLYVLFGVYLEKKRIMTANSN